MVYRVMPHSSEGSRRVPRELAAVSGAVEAITGHRPLALRELMASRDS
jgi:hypothetical protein